MDWKDTLGALLPDDYTPADNPAESSAPEAETEKARLTVSVEKKGRGGKTATIVSGFTVSDQAVADIAAALKKSLATGGSARGAEILIQGNCRERVIAALRNLGLKA